MSIVVCTLRQTNDLATSLFRQFVLRQVKQTSRKRPKRPDSGKSGPSCLREDMLDQASQHPTLCNTDLATFLFRQFVLCQVKQPSRKRPDSAPKRPDSGKFGPRCLREDMLDQASQHPTVRFLSRKGSATSSTVS